MNPIVFSAALTYLIVMLWIVYRISKTSKFWVFMISVEYFYILGLGVFPILWSFDESLTPSFAPEINFSRISVLTGVHIYAYAVGALLAALSLRSSTHVAKLCINWSARANLNVLRMFRLFWIVPLGAMIVYIASVGWDVALLSASAVRSGNMEAYTGGAQFLFLKSVVGLGLFGVAFMPFFLVHRIHVLRAVCLLAVCGLCTYLITVSRYALMQAIVLPFALFVVYNYKRKFSSYVLIVLGAIFVAIVMIYGKSFVSGLGEYLFNGSTKIVVHEQNDGNLLDQFSGLFFSVNAGIEHFLSGDWEIPKDLIVASIGWIPRGLMSSLGLSWLLPSPLQSGQMASCVNTMQIIGAYDSCFIPPYYVGVSAYMLPVVGGFIFGYVRFFIYSTVSRAWRILDGNGRDYLLPTILLLMLIVLQLMLFIPSAMSTSIFMVIIYFILKKFMKYSNRGLS